MRRSESVDSLRSTSILKNCNRNPIVRDWHRSCGYETKTGIPKQEKAGRCGPSSTGTASFIRLKSKFSVPPESGVKMKIEVDFLLYLQGVYSLLCFRASPKVRRGSECEDRRQT